MTILSLEGMKCFLLESKQRYYEHTRRDIPRDYKISCSAKLEFIEYLLEQIQIAETKEKKTKDLTPEQYDALTIGRFIPKSEVDE